MAEPTFFPPNAVGPIRDVGAQRVCSMAGIRTAQERVVDLRKIRAGLDASIKELETDRRTEDLVNKALLVARFTKATCDAFISMASALAPEKLKAGAETVEHAYTMGSTAAETISTAATGTKVDWWNVGTTVVKDGAAMVADKKFGKGTTAAITKANKGTNEAIKIVANSTAVKVELVKGALNNDKKGLIKSSAFYLIELHTSIAENHLGEKGDISAKLVKVAKAGFEYNDKIGEAFQSALDDDDETASRYQSNKRTLIHNAKMLSKQIGEMEAFISDCQNWLNKPPFNDASKAPSKNRA